MSVINMIRNTIEKISFYGFRGYGKYYPRNTPEGRSVHFVTTRDRPFRYSYGGYGNISDYEIRKMRKVKRLKILRALDGIIQ